MRAYDTSGKASQGYGCHSLRNTALVPEWSLLASTKALARLPEWLVQVPEDTFVGQVSI
jgi:hypothetical protein